MAQQTLKVGQTAELRLKAGDTLTIGGYGEIACDLVGGQSRAYSLTGGTVVAGPFEQDATCDLVGGFGNLAYEIVEAIVFGTGALNVTGASAVGHILTAAFGGNNTGTVQWYRDGSPISGATSLTYTLQVADAGHTITARSTSIVFVSQGVTVPSSDVLAIFGTPVTTGTVGSAYAGFTVSASGGQAPYTFSVASGSLPAGLTLSATTGAVSGTPSSVVTATGIVLRVTDNLGATADLDPFAIVISAPGAAPVNTVLPAITGTTTEGQLLTVSNGTWSNSPTSFARQWKRNGTNIGGATGATYTLVTADVGATITCTVTATNGSGSTPATSAGVGPIGALIDTRPRFGLGAANAWTASPAALLSGMTALTGSSQGGHAGTFSLTTTSGNFGWVAVLASASASGVHFNDGLGFGGWSGAGLAGNNSGASPDPTTSTTLYTDGNGTQWRLFRQDFINANPTAASYTLS